MMIMSLTFTWRFVTSHNRRGTSETSITSVVAGDSANSSRRGSEEDYTRARGSGALRIFKRKESRYFIITILPVLISSSCLNYFYLNMFNDGSNKYLILFLQGKPVSHVTRRRSLQQFPFQVGASDDRGDRDRDSDVRNEASTSARARSGTEKTQRVDSGGGDITKPIQFKGGTAERQVLNLVITFKIYFNC